MQVTRSGPTCAVGTRQVGIWVPGRLAAAAKLVLSRPSVSGVQETLTDVFVAAFNAHAYQLSAAPATAGPPAMPARRRRRRLVEATQVWLYLNKSQVDSLDAAVVSTGMSSRSALVTKVLEAALLDATSPAGRAAAGR